jgi:hypothetical protein
MHPSAASSELDRVRIQPDGCLEPLSGVNPLRENDSWILSISSTAHTQSRDPARGAWYRTEARLIPDCMASILIRCPAGLKATSRRLEQRIVS